MLSEVRGFVGDTYILYFLDIGFLCFRYSFLSLTCGCLILLLIRHRVDDCFNMPLFLIRSFHVIDSQLGGANSYGPDMRCCGTIAFGTPEYTTCDI